MEQIKTLNKANLKESAVKGGCGECQASCQSACKTSCTIANQKCENANTKVSYCEGHVLCSGSSSHIDQETKGQEPVP